jgi:hypothetical protein
MSGHSVHLCSAKSKCGYREAKLIPVSESRDTKRRVTRETEELEKRNKRARKTDTEISRNKYTEKPDRNVHTDIGPKTLHALSYNTDLDYGTLESKSIVAR